MIRFVLTGLVLSLALQGPALAQEPSIAALAKKPIVAVFNIDARGVKLSKSAKSALRDWVETQLMWSGMYAVVPHDKLKEALSRQKTTSYKACYAQSCQNSIGQEVGANLSLSTRISKIGKECMVTIKLYDVRKATTKKAATRKGKCSEDDILYTVDDVMAKLTDRYASPSPSASDAKAESKPEQSPSQVMARHKTLKGQIHALMMQGNDAYVAGKHKRVILFAQHVLKLNPKHIRAIQLLGASACYLKNKRQVQWALERLKPAPRALLKKICNREGLPL